MKNSARAAVALTWLAFTTVGACSQEVATGPYADEAAYSAAASAATIYISGLDLVGLSSAIELEIDDQVDDSCWTNSSAVAARVRAELEKFGIAIFQEDLAFNTAAAPVLRIIGLGYRLPNDVCVASVQMEVIYWSQHDLGSLAYTTNIYALQSWTPLWSSEVLLSNGKNVDQQVLDKAQEWVDTYIADISKARRIPAVQAAYQRWYDTDPMSQIEFDEMLANLAEAKK